MSHASQTSDTSSVIEALVEAARPLPERALVLEDSHGELTRALIDAGVAVVSIVADAEVGAQLAERFAGDDVEIRSGDLLASWGYPRQGDLFETESVDRQLFDGAPFPVVLVDARNATIASDERSRLRSEFRTARNRFGRDVVVIERASQLAGVDGRLVFACRPDLFAREVGVALSESVLAERGPHLVVDARQALPPRILVAETSHEINRSIRPRPGVPAENRWNVLLEGMRLPASPWVDQREIASGLSDPADALDSSAARLLIAAIEAGGDGVAADLMATKPGRTTACGFRDVWLSKAGGHTRPLAGGDDVRDWSVRPSQHVVWPYERAGRPVNNLDGPIAMQLAPHRPLLESRRIFGDPIARRGLLWWEHAEHYPSRIEAPHRVICSTRGTHNHAALLTETGVLASSSAIVAPTIDADSAFLLLGLLNSSLICFWFKHTAARRRRFEITVSQLLELPLPAKNRDAIGALARKVDRLARQLRPIRDVIADAPVAEIRARVDAERAHRDRVLGEMVFWQEELDWAVYAGFGLVRKTDSDTLPRALKPHERAYLSARSHPSRAALIEHDSILRAVERRNYKRPFVEPDLADEIEDAGNDLLVERLTGLLSEGEARPLEDLRQQFQVVAGANVLAAMLGLSPAEWFDEFVAGLADVNPASVYTPRGWSRRQASFRSATAATRREVGDHGDSSRPVFFGRSDFVDTKHWSARGRHDVVRSELLTCRDMEALEGRIWLIRRPRDPRNLTTYEDTLRSLYLERAFHIPERPEDAGYWAVCAVFENSRAMGRLLRAVIELPSSDDSDFGESVSVEHFAKSRQWIVDGRPTPPDQERQLDLDRLARMKALLGDGETWSLRGAAERLRDEGWPSVDVRRTLESLVESGWAVKTDEGYSSAT